ncbi:MAG: PAS domain-containing protein [Paracoccaceae bacterium]
MMNPRNGSGNVTPLMPYLKPMQHPVLSELLDYWERLRAGRLAPPRSEVDPRRIESALEHAFILEQAPGAPRFRLAGQRICELMGMEIRSMPATSVIAPGCRAQFTALIQTLFVNPAVLVLDLDCARPGQPGLKAEMLLLPLTNDAGIVTRILGCMVTAGRWGQPPHRFAILDVKRTRIVAREDNMATDAPAGFAESASVFIPPAPKTAGKETVRKPRPPYLRLVRSRG